MMLTFWSLNWALGNSLLAVQVDSSVHLQLTVLFRVYRCAIRWLNKRAENESIFVVVSLDSPPGNVNGIRSSNINKLGTGTATYDWRNLTTQIKNQSS